MTPFLQQIARRYMAECGDSLSRMAFVFPNRRAGLFFRKYLSRETKTPFFAPDILAINDLFFAHSSLLQADKVTLHFALYKAYCSVVPNPESFDRFYFLGEMLLADFNDIDKYMADAEQVFQNISDIKQIESDLSWLSDEQKEVITHFWQGFLQHKGGEFERQFAEIWAKMFDIYAAFKTELRQRGVAYDGMIFRDVIENDSLQFDYERIVFVGFNALTTTELRLFKRCQSLDVADFYFDYQSPEISEKTKNIAAQFMAENRQFRSRFPLDASAQPVDRQIELIAVPSEIGQTKQAYQILEKLQAENPQNSDLKTVVVLPNEQLLVPMLHAIPANVPTTNVTMGYPLSLTPVATLMEQIVLLQRNKRAVNGETNFFHKNVTAILNHPLISENFRETTSEILLRMRQESLFLVPQSLFAELSILSTIFQPIETTADFLRFFGEVIEALLPFVEGDERSLDRTFLECYQTAVRRLSDNLAIFPIDLSPEMFLRLLRQLTTSLAVAFKGEPIEGLQLMGTLETRALDFENVIITSFNEDIFPRKSNSPSIIPYNLRRAFGLPTYEYHDAIFAYNFYRLIYRAKRVFLIYDSRTDGLHGELSRYASQMDFLYHIPIVRKAVGYEVSAEPPRTITIAKTGEVVEKLQKLLDPKSKEAISASSLTDYLDCPLRFYYSRLQRISEPDELTETIESDTFGSIYHRTMELLYEPYKNCEIDKTIVEKLKSNLETALRRAFTDVYFKKRKDMPLIGRNLLVACAIEQYALKTLARDLTRVPFVYRESELLIEHSLPFDQNRSVNIKGFIDRVDEISDKTFVIDYKTGHAELNFKSIDELFDPNIKKRPKAVLQTFLYSLIYTKQHAANVKPLVYQLQNLDENELCRKVGNESQIVEDFADFSAEYEAKLHETLKELFDLNVPFVQTTEMEHCKYCNFKDICSNRTMEGDVDSDNNSETEEY